MCTHRGGPVTGRAGRDIRAGDERVPGRPCVHADRRNRPAGRWPGRDERGHLRAWHWAGRGCRGSVTGTRRRHRRVPPSPRACAQDQCVLPGVCGGVFSVLLEGTRVEQGRPTSHPRGPRSAPRRSRSLSLVQAAVFPSVEAQETSHPPPPAAAWAQAASAPRGPTRETGGKEPHDALRAIEVRQGHLRSG